MTQAIRRQGRALHRACKRHRARVLAQAAQPRGLLWKPARHLQVRGAEIGGVILDDFSVQDLWPSLDVGTWQPMPMAEPIPPISIAGAHFIPMIAFPPTILGDVFTGDKP